MVYWGIIGCGKIAHKFANDLKFVEGGTLYAVASRSRNRAQEFAKTHDAAIFYDDYNALLYDPKVTIVYIATPHKFHKEQTILYLENKKAVLCEKAFGMDATEVRAMIDCAKKNNTFLMEALWTKFLPHFQYAQSLVESGKLGNVQKLEADFGINVPFNPDGRLYNKAVGGGSLLDVGLYPVFAALSFMGYPEQVSARATFGPTDVDHQCEMEFQYGPDKKATLFSAIDKKTASVCRIILEKGILLINSRFHEPSSITIIQEHTEETVNFPIPDGVHGYYYEILHCHEMLAPNVVQSSCVTFENSLNLIKLLDTVREKIGLDYH